MAADEPSPPGRNARDVTAESAHPSMLGDSMSPTSSPNSSRPSLLTSSMAENSTSHRHRLITCDETGGYSSASRSSFPKKMGTPGNPTGRLAMYAVCDDSVPRYRSYNSLSASLAPHSSLGTSSMSSVKLAGSLARSCDSCREPGRLTITSSFLMGPSAFRVSPCVLEVMASAGWTLPRPATPPPPPTCSSSGCCGCCAAAATARSTARSLRCDRYLRSVPTCRSEQTPRIETIIENF